MAGKPPAKRKRHTQEHVIADQSVNHVERFIIDEGHTAERVANDYGYDLLLFTYEEEGYPEQDSVALQLKASEKFKLSGDDLVFDIDIRDYDLWNAELMPVILILFDASQRRAYWVYVQRYFAEDASQKPKPGAKTVRIRVRKRQVFSRSAVRKIREYKRRIGAQLGGVVDHG